MRTLSLVVVALGFFLSNAAFAQNGTEIQELLGNGFKVVAASDEAIYLQKGSELYLCMMSVKTPASNEHSCYLVK